MKISLDVGRPGQFNIPETKLNSIQLAWKNLMNECLIGTKICTKHKSDYRKRLSFDPNFVMDMRHKMKNDPQKVTEYFYSEYFCIHTFTISHQSQQSSKTFLTSPAQTYCEALEILRLENHNMLLQQKENKVIEKEIGKVKQILENHRLLIKMQIDQTTNKKVKLSNIPKFAKYYPKLQERSEYYEVECSFNQPIHKITKTSINQQKIQVDAKTPLKKDGQKKKSLESIPILKSSIVKYDTENEKYFLEIEEGKSVIMKKLFNKDTKELEPKLRDSTKDSFITKKELELQITLDQKRLEYAWRTWKAFIHKLKNRRREKTIYTCKIESFLSYVQAKETKQDKTRQLKVKMNLEHEIKTIRMMENQVKINTLEAKEEKLKKIVQEIKASQAHTKKKLQKISKTCFKNKGKLSHDKFLQKIENSRQERLKRREEIHEKKLMLKEKKKKAQIQLEERKIQKEKEIKRKRLEELKKKRTLEEESKREQKEKAEKLKLKRKLAENHYKTYLLRAYGWRPWGTLLKMRDSQCQHAAAFYEKKVTQRIFCKWMILIKEQMELMAAFADKFYKKTLKKNCMFMWTKLIERKKKQNQVAVDWNEFKIIERAFNKWLQFAQHEILEYSNKKRIVKLFYERKLKKKSMTRLRAYPEFKKLEQAKEIRKRIWRQKIKEILPDFQTTYVSEYS